VPDPLQAIPDSLRDMLPQYNRNRIHKLRLAGDNAFYRGFHISFPVDGWRDDDHAERQYQVEWRTQTNFWIPATFSFTGSSEDLLNYLDALLARDKILQALYEDRKMVSQVVERKAPINTPSSRSARSD
jgi:hypothetical protein